MPSLALAQADFDAASYLALNPDVAVAVGFNGDLAYRHYIDYGMAEERAASGFSAYGYMVANPDVAGAIGYDASAAVRHYALYGRSEGRQVDSFDPLRYLASNDDLALAFGGNLAAATAHYATAGRAEGRNTDSFDAAGYLASNPDLAKAFGYRTDLALQHYVASGVREGRSDGDFSAEAYLRQNPDLMNAIGLNEDAAKQHFIRFGLTEGRSTGIDDSEQLLDEAVDEVAFYSLAEGAVTVVDAVDDNLSFAYRSDQTYYVSFATLLKNDTPSGASVTSVKVPTSGANGTIWTDKSGVYFKTNQKTATTGKFLYTINRNGKTDTATAKISISAAAPNAINDSFSNLARTTDGRYTIQASQLTSNDSGSEIALSSVSKATSGSVSVSKNTISFLSSGSQNSGSFSYTVKDVFGKTSTASVSLGFVQVPTTTPQPAITKDDVWVSDWVGTEGTNKVSKTADFYIRLKKSFDTDITFDAVLDTNIGGTEVSKKVTVKKGQTTAKVSFAIGADSSSESATNVGLNLSLSGKVYASSKAIVFNDDWVSDAGLAAAVAGTSGVVTGNGANTFIISKSYANHKGIDIKDTKANTSRTVSSPVDGVVEKISEISDSTVKIDGKSYSKGSAGKYVRIRLPSETGEADQRYFFHHLESVDPGIVEGQLIGKGTVIGTYKKSEKIALKESGGSKTGDDGAKYNLYDGYNHVHVEESLSTSMTSSSSSFDVANWQDTDGDGIRDDGEAAISGTAASGVTLYNPNYAFAVQESYRNIADTGDWDNARRLGVIAGGTKEIYTTLSFTDIQDSFRFDIVERTTINARISVNSAGQDMTLGIYRYANGTPTQLGTANTSSKVKPNSGETTNDGVTGGISLDPGTYYAVASWSETLPAIGTTDTTYRIRLANSSPLPASGNALLASS